MNIHPTAIIDPAADLHESVCVGPYAIIEGGVKLGAGCKVAAHAQLLGSVTAGENCEFGAGSVVGDFPQDLSFDPSTQSGVIMGNGNRLREHVTIHRGSKEGTYTKLGSGNFIMVGAHLGHNCEIQDDNVIANLVMLAGHVQVGSRCFFGGGAGFHQFSRVGDYCMIQGNASMNKDAPPYTICARYAEVWGLNVVGLRRAKFSSETRQDIKRAFDFVYRNGLNVSQALEQAATMDWGPEATSFLEFFKGPSRQGICRFNRD